MSLESKDADAAAVAKTSNRVSMADIEARIVGEEYMNCELIPHLTIAVLKLDNGYAVIGQSAPADPENFNFELGKKFARQNAVEKIWPLEGYLLAERLKGESL